MEIIRQDSGETGPDATQVLRAAVDQTNIEVALFYDSTKPAELSTGDAVVAEVSRHKVMKALGIAPDIPA